MIAKKYIGLSAMALSLAMSFPACAETTAAAPPSMPMASGPQGGMMMGPNGKGPMGGEFREEMNKMHQEQQALDAAIVQLLNKCIPTPKDQIDACKKEKADWLARDQKLKGERKTMHEKMQAMHKERMEMRGQGGMMPGGTAAPAAPQAPAK